MCGFVGFVDFENKFQNKKDIVQKMNNKIGRRGPDEEGYFTNNIIALGHKRLIVIDPDNGSQPMSATFNRKYLYKLLQWSNI